MADRFTDRKAVFQALHIAIDTESSLVDAYRDHLTREVDETEEGVIIARKNIAAFKRVLERYYGTSVHPRDEYLKGAKLVPIMDILKGAHKSTDSDEEQPA